MYSVVDSSGAALSAAVSALIQINAGTIEVDQFKYLKGATHDLLLKAVTPYKDNKG